MVDETKKIYLLDTRGTFCPEPIIRTAELMKEIELGEIIKLLSDDPGVVPDMEAWCKSNGQKLIGQHCQEEDFTYILYIEKLR
jgi:tRNA 2-thiouridine synthesizing protein A